MGFWRLDIYDAHKKLQAIKPFELWRKMARILK